MLYRLVYIIKCFKRNHWTHFPSRLIAYFFFNTMVILYFIWYLLLYTKCYICILLCARVQNSVVVLPHVIIMAMLVIITVAFRSCVHRVLLVCGTFSWGLGNSHRELVGLPLEQCSGSSCMEAQGFGWGWGSTYIRGTKNSGEL